MLADSVDLMRQEARRDIVRSLDRRGAGTVEREKHGGSQLVLSSDRTVFIKTRSGHGSAPFYSVSPSQLVVDGWFVFVLGEDEPLAVCDVDEYSWLCSLGRGPNGGGTRPTFQRRGSMLCLYVDGALRDVSGWLGAVDQIR